MKSLAVIEKFESASLEWINDFENKYGIKIPCELKFFLSTQNIFTTSENQFVKNGDTFEVHHFYPLHPESELSLSVIYDALHEYFESSFIPIGDDSGGWQYVVSIRDVDYGAVFFCRMDEELENALTYLAENVEVFINGLTSKENLV